jgi:hypothetical protein
MRLNLKASVKTAHTHLVAIVSYFLSVFVAIHSLVVVEVVLLLLLPNRMTLRQPSHSLLPALITVVVN